MSYTDAYDPSLPSYVKARELMVRQKWVAIFNAAEAKYGPTKAIVVANSWLKKELTPKKLIKRCAVSFEVVHGKKLIKRSADGQDYITLVMANTNIHADGNKFTEDNLKKMAKQINENAIVGDVDHKLFDKLVSEGLSAETIANILKQKSGIAKTVKAIYEKGKLWVRAFIDKRYSKLINKSNGVSLEAIAEEGSSDWDILGFTFNVKSTPAVPGAGVV